MGSCKTDQITPELPSLICASLAPGPAKGAPGLAFLPGDQEAAPGAAGKRFSRPFHQHMIFAPAAATMALGYSADPI